MESTRFNLGLTVAELKAQLADWPETNEIGEPTEVWIETKPGLSSPCFTVEPLNCRKLEDGTRVADVLLG